MAKTLLNLISEASALADETFDNARWVEWFNNGLDDLTTVLYMSKKSTITEDTEGSAIFSIPADFLSFIRLDTPAYITMPRVSPNDDTTIGYKVLGDKIYLQGDTSATIALTYYRRPTYLTTANTSATLDAPELCARALIYYACAQAMLREDESERYANFNEEYLRAKQLVVKSNRIFGASTTGAWTVVR